MQAPAHLLHTYDCEVGYTRKKRGAKFVYFDENNQPIADKKIVERLEQLHIPPAWEKVWICKEHNGYLQCSGYDNRQRKQYIYHPEWASYRNLYKFQNIYDFGKDLNIIRPQVWHDIALRGWPKEKVVALAIAVLDETYVRVGNQYYSDTNQTYGLTTLRRKHMQTHSTNIKFSYIAKGGKPLQVTLANKKLCKIIKACSELPGYPIFQYKDDDGKICPITSQDINNNLQNLTQKPYTAKDFRTWGGSVTALECLSDIANLSLSPQKMVNLVVKQVSKTLNNTVAICKKYYIHPAVLCAIEKETTSAFLSQAKRMKRFPELDLYEKQLMVILKDYYQSS